MKKFGYRAASIALAVAAAFVLDIHVHFLRFLGGAVLIAISLFMWNSTALTP